MSGVEICCAGLDRVGHWGKIHEMREFYIRLVIARADRVFLLAGLALEFCLRLSRVASPDEITVLPVEAPVPVILPQLEYRYAEVRLIACRMLSHPIERSDIGAQRVSVNTLGFRELVGGCP